MTLKRLLEEFTPDQTRRVARTSSPPDMTSLDIEATKKAAFEDGYASGWEDAKNADKSAGLRIDAEFERCLQDLAFTYHEALGQVRSELVPLIEALLDSFFSALVPELLKETVREEILKVADSHLAPSIELQVTVDMAEKFEDLLSGHTDLAITVRPEPSLAPGQAFVRIEHTEILVDFEPLLDVARSQLAALSENQKMEVANG